MDSQFNSLIQSYSSNFVQYKVTGNQSYQNSYTSAQQGLDSIINDLQSEVNSGKAQISAFYKSGIEEKIKSTDAKNRKLQRGILSEKDEIAGAKIRNEKPASTPVSTGQYIALGVLAVTMLGLSMI
uniref:t-SNARE coiled-coil homology domain-containing protein n=1 Tax=viral metagenome TaxID=1070528 RepID=A0A6C0EQB1_9ZZZZ